MRAKLKHESIQCRADESSATEYHVQRIIGGQVFEYEVMAYTRNDAEQTVDRYLDGKIEQPTETTEALL